MLGQRFFMAYSLGISKARATIVSHRAEEQIRVTILSRPISLSSSGWFFYDKYTVNVRKILSPKLNLQSLQSCLRRQSLSRNQNRSRSHFRLLAPGNVKKNLSFKNDD